MTNEAHETHARKLAEQMARTDEHSTATLIAMREAGAEDAANHAMDIQAARIQAELASGRYPRDVINASETQRNMLLNRPPRTEEEE